ncbi:MAG: M56 family metallopeptidase [Vicinamibacterales bacterium]
MEAIVNWIWQGVVLTTVTTVALHWSSRLSATTRYLVWWLTLVLVLGLPLAPRLALEPAVAPSAVATLAPLPLPELPFWPLTLVLAGWVVWVAISLTRVAISVGALVAARRRVTPFPATRELVLPHWAAVRIHGRPARLALCDRIPAAAVFGLGPAIIAVSPDICARLTDDELDQVIVHEWAHVQRRDDFSRLAQIGVRVIAGLHPAVWWIGRRLEIERETACDDCAVNVTGAARNLARCLTKLAEAGLRPMPVMLAPNVLASSQLATRVQRLLDPSRNTSTVRVRGVLGPIAAALVALAAGLSQVELVAAGSPLPPPVPARSVAAPATVAVGSVELERLQVEAPTMRPATERGVNGSRSSDAAATSAQVPARPAPTPAVVEAPVEPTTVGSLAPLDRAAWSGAALPGLGPVASPSDAVADPGPPDRAQTPWGAAADAGVAIGRGSQKAGAATADAGVSIGRGSTKAAVATAGFFSRLGRRLGGSF